MLKGFSTPLSPLGCANLTPAPPWHYAGDLLVIEFWADGDAVRAVLPPGITAGRDAGRCLAFFADWQACTNGREELLDPVRAQYREFFVLVSGRYKVQPVMTCPYIFVDQDTSMMRGLIQGFPKVLGSIHVTRAFCVEGMASPPLAPGSVFAGTASAKGRRLAEGWVKLTGPAAAPPPMDSIVTLRYFPSFDAGKQQSPAAAELVWSLWEDRRISAVWTGDAELSFFASPCHELQALAPLRVGSGYRFSMAMTICHAGQSIDIREAWTR
jgi:acetoacetate decarboxylase